MTVLEHDHGEVITVPYYPVPVIASPHDKFPIFGHNFHGTSEFLHVHAGDVRELTGVIDQYRYIVVEDEGLLVLEDECVLLGISDIILMPPKSRETTGGRLLGLNLKGGIFWNCRQEPWDTYEYGGCLYVGGRATIDGARVVTPNAMLSETAKAGAQTIGMQSVPEDWREGDLVFVEGTRARKFKEIDGKPLWVPETEVRRIQSMTADTITFDKPLEKLHPTLTDKRGVTYYPAIGNMERDFLFSGEQSAIKPHVMVAGRGVLELTNVAHREVGRSHRGVKDGPDGQLLLARYATHSHHCLAAPTTADGQWRHRVEGCSYYKWGKWAVVCHATHHSLVKRNVGCFGEGAAIVTEQGDEYGNHFIENHFGAVTGFINEKGAMPDHDRNAFVSAFTGEKVSIFDGLALSGTVYWFRAHGNHCENNRGFDSNTCARTDGYYNQEEKIWAPRVGMEYEEYASKGTRIMPYNGYSGFVGAGCGDGEVNVWDCGMGGPPREKGYPVHWYEGHVYWNFSRMGFRPYHTGGLKFRNCVAVTDPEAGKTYPAKREMAGFLLGSNDYTINRIEFDGCYTSGANYGVDNPVHLDALEMGPAVFQRCFFSGNLACIRQLPPLIDVEIVMVDCVLDPASPLAVEMITKFGSQELPMARFKMAINGQQYFFTQQAADFVFPGRKPVPETHWGLSNEECVRRGLSPMYGEIAPEGAVSDPRVKGGLVYSVIEGAEE